MLFGKEVDKLLQNIAEDITFVLLKNKIIDMKDRDIYIYGFQIILSTLIVTSTLLGLGLLLDKMIITLGFMIVFILLRTYTGGYHADKFRSCFIISITIYLSELLLSGVVPDNFKRSIGMICIFIATLIIYRLSPVEHKNNPLSLKEKNKYRKISRLLTLLITTISLLGFFVSEALIDFWFIVSLTVIAVAILILIQLIKGGVKVD